MIDFTYDTKLSFVVPETEEHYSKAVVEASVSSNGNEIKVGRYTATKIRAFGGSSCSSRGDWRVRSSDPEEWLPHVPDKNNFCRFLPPGSNGLIIHWLAEMEARRLTPNSAIATAFQSAMRGKLETLENSAPAVLADLDRDMAAQKRQMALAIKHKI